MEKKLEIAPVCEKNMANSASSSFFGSLVNKTAGLSKIGPKIKNPISNFKQLMSLIKKAAKWLKEYLDTETGCRNTPEGDSKELVDELRFRFISRKDEIEQKNNQR